MGNTHDHMANDMGLMTEDERRIAYSTNEEPLDYNSWQEDMRGSGGSSRLSGLYGFFWLNETNQMNPINPENRDRRSRGRLCLAFEQVIEMGEGGEGRRSILLPARRCLTRRVSHLIPLVLIVVAVETE